MASGKKCPEFTSFETIPDAVIITGRDGSIVFANRHADRVFGYERGKLIGLTIESLISEGHRERHAWFVGEFFAEPSARPMGTNREFRGVRSDGKEFPVQIAIGLDESGTYTVAVVRDMTAFGKREPGCVKAKRNRMSWTRHS